MPGMSGNFRMIRRLARYRETILVVHRGVLDRHGDFAVHQVSVSQIGNSDVLPLALFGREQRAECGTSHCQSD
jgi:hypothetical protein